MPKKISTEQAYTWAAGRCSLREFCRSEVLTKFLEKGLSRPEAEKLLDRLEDGDFINEDRYARAFVHDKTLYDRWGRIKTRQALRMRGIDNDKIEAALALIDEEEYMAMLRGLLAQKSKSVKAENEYEMRQKLVRYAAGRGFEPEMVFSAVEDL